MSARHPKFGENIGDLLSPRDISAKVEENQNGKTDSSRKVKFEIIIKDIDNALKLEGGMQSKIPFYGLLFRAALRVNAQSELFSLLI